jgi:hypothetical protein
MRHFPSVDTMKLFSIGSLLAVAFAEAWTPISIQKTCEIQKTYSPTALDMASRGAQKWARKQEWLAKRGYDEGATEGGSKATVASSTMTIIGAGRIGSLLEQGGESIMVGREDSIDPNGSGPIVVATRNDALDGIVEKCPENRRKDLVFTQNGYLDDFLESKGLLDNTQALLYLSVTAKGAKPVDGITSVNPEGLTAATGIHAQAFADRLAALGLKCNVVTPEEYRPAMFEKLM